MTGVLQRVALTDREIVVIGPGAKGEPELESILTVPEDARITKDAKPAKLEDLKEGERVVVRTEKRGDKMAGTQCWRAHYQTPLYGHLRAPKWGGQLVRFCR